MHEVDYTQSILIIYFLFSLGLFHFYLNEIAPLKPSPLSIFSAKHDEKGKRNKIVERN